MSTVTITPELSLQLQQSVNEVGLTEKELKSLLDPETLAIILPFLLGRSKISPYCSFSVWKEIKVGGRLKTGADLVSALQGVGVKIGTFSYLPAEALQNPTSVDVEYELFLTSLKELGFGERENYKTVEARARVLEIHDATVPATLAAELLLKGILSTGGERVSYRVFSQPAPTSELLGEVVFAVESGFPSEEQDGKLFTERDFVFNSIPYGIEDDIVTSEQLLIFARQTNGRLGHEPFPHRAGMWPVAKTNGRYLNIR